MKKILFALPLIAALAACDQQSATLGGAAAGAAIGASVSGDDDKVTGAIVGATLGGLAGNYIGKTQAGRCVYERADGSRYYAACP